MRLAEMERSSSVADSVEVEYEKHYNHYGDRGVVDLYAQAFDGGYRSDTLYEVKSRSALNEATGANEILRQFNRMCKYFYAGVEDSYPPNGSYGPHAELCFVASKEAFEHIKENYGMYESINKKEYDAVTGNITARVTVRSLEGPTKPFLVFDDEYGLHGDMTSLPRNRELFACNEFDAHEVEI